MGCGVDGEAAEGDESGANCKTIVEDKFSHNEEDFEVFRTKFSELFK